MFLLTSAINRKSTKGSVKHEAYIFMRLAYPRPSIKTVRAIEKMVRLNFFQVHKSTVSYKHLGIFSSSQNYSLL